MVSGQGVRAAHTNAHIARADSHVHCACVALEGRGAITRASETIELEPGDIFITDSRHPFALDLDRPWRHLVLTVPTDCLDARVVRAERLAGAVLRGLPLARLWASHLAAVFALEADLSPGAGALAARYSLDLLTQLVDETAEGEATEAAGAATYASACRAIELNYGDPALTPAKIAKAIGVSSRTLARAFAARNETVMRRVFEERVARAAKLMRSPQTAHRSITEIAFACGFNDLSHFGRVFARKMQMAPSEWRRRGSGEE